MAALGSKTLQAPRRQEHTRGVHKRAYAQISVKGGGKASCSGGITAIESNVQKTHSALMSTEGGRLTPQPVLESFEMANDGGQDASDAMLFEASAKVKVFSLGDLNDMENIITYLRETNTSLTTEGLYSIKKTVKITEAKIKARNVNRNLTFLPYMVF